ncbi:MAG: hypothetical protein A3F09_02075 [Chlamydiae bacterium RIFCSPHIGHO2_12_FULL_49_11]|nr:MAG: hypothetical protein A3F09_02075 [Chlamydiae bacterium RIFCSPHIGHO2_12_FULL_49_11]
MNRCVKNIRTCSRAFTLLELVLVIALLAMVGGWIASYSGKMVAQYKVRSTKKRLSAELQYARQMAAIYGITIEIDFAEGKKGLIMVEDVHGQFPPKIALGTKQIVLPGLSLEDAPASRIVMRGTDFRCL